MSKKVPIIARREFITTVKRKAYIIATLGIPLAFVLIGCIVAIPNWLALNRTVGERAVGIIDEAQLIRKDLVAQIQKEFEGNKEEFLNYQKGEILDPERFIGKMDLHFYTSEEKAKQDLANQEIVAFLVLEKDYVETGNCRMFYPKKSLISRTMGVRLFLKKLIIASLLEGQVDETLWKRVQKPLRAKEFSLGDKGSFNDSNNFAELGRIFVPYLFSILLMLSILTTSSYLIQGMAEEKENRVMEVLLSSVTADDLFKGKLLGLGAAGFLQFSVWVTITFLPALLLLTFVEIPPDLFVFSLLYFLLGAGLYGSIITGFGSLGSKVQESHQIAALWAGTSIVPLLFFSILYDAPNGLLARCLSYFPLTSPVTMILRLSTGDVHWIDIPITIAILVTSIYLAIVLCSRLFRVAILLYGKRPKFREIARWMLKS